MPIHAYTYIPLTAFANALPNAESMVAEAMVQGAIRIKEDIAEEALTSQSFTFQYAPETLDFGRSVDWVLKEGIGVNHPGLQYVGGRLVELPLDILLVDEPEGIPQPDSTEGTTFVMEDWIHWFRLLTYPLASTLRPPTLEITFGEWFTLDDAIVSRWNSRVEKMWRNSTVRQVMVHLDLIGELTS